MSTNPPKVIAATNLSYAWAKAFLEVFSRPKISLCPLCISLDGFTNNTPVEIPEIRRALDASLSNHPQPPKYSVAVTAATIFPKRGQFKTDFHSRNEMYQWYLEKLLPRLKKRDPRNSHGTYFERMIAFEGARHKEIKQVNQLELIIKDWTRPRAKIKRPRHSALQVSCFDPVKDQTGQSVRGFPCLQQVSFGYDDSEGLSISAYYPTQYIYDRAYGNYLGLCQLGAFMAGALGLSLARFNCFIAYPQLGATTKTEVRNFASVIHSLVLMNADTAIETTK